MTYPTAFEILDLCVCYRKPPTTDRSLLVRHASHLVAVLKNSFLIACVNVIL